MTAIARDQIPCPDCDTPGYVWYENTVTTCDTCHGTGWVSMAAQLADKRLWLAAAFWFFLALALIVVWVLAQP